MTDYRVKLAIAAAERAGALTLRRQVFCAEQAIFQDDDRDAVDATAIPIVALVDPSDDAPQVVGTVRIHEEAPGLWWGSRLAVDAAFRRQGSIGPSLIRLAVGTAHARGCTRFLAHVQSRNAVLFKRLHWRTLQELDLHGRPHHLMEADLAWYPPDATGEVGFTLWARAAA